MARLLVIPLALALGATTVRATPTPLRDGWVRMPAVEASGLTRACITILIVRTAAGTEHVVPVLLGTAGAHDATVAELCGAPMGELRVGEPHDDFRSNGWSVGIEGAWGRASFAGGTAGFDEPRTGLGATFIADHAVTSQWSLRTGLGFVQRGGTSKVGTSTVVVAVNYLELPLWVRYRWRTTRAIVPVLFGGPNVAVRVSCAFWFSGTGPSSTESCQEASVGGGRPRVTDAGLTFGGGADIPMGPMRLEIGIRHVTGLVSMGAPLDVRHSGWATVAGVTLPVAMLRR